MPPKPEPQSSPSKQFLVSTKSRPSNHAEDTLMALVPHKSSGPHPTSERALVLRKAAYGTGEVILAKKISGQEKLSLLAEATMKSALRAPFNMQELSRKVDAQMGVHLDDITNFQDPESFYDDILATLGAITPQDQRRSMFHDTHWIANAVGTRIHNTYLLAGSWRIVRNVLKQLDVLRLNESDVRGDLRSREKVRERYLVLYDMVTVLARLGQQRLANIAACTAHYAPYFAPRSSLDQQEEWQFDYAGRNLRKLREAHKSFIDAIILELALPNSEYPPFILIALLHDAVEECRKEQQRFSQALWDAVGDFSVIIEILDILEGPLVGKEAEDWIRNTVISSEHKDFLHVQELSRIASKDINGWRPYFTPLISIKKKEVHARLWQSIQKSYKKVSHSDIDELWNLQNELHIQPQWSPNFLDVDPAEGSDQEGNKSALVLHSNSKYKSQAPAKQRQITNEDEEDETIPGLIDLSDSSDGDMDPISDDSSDEDNSEGDLESDFDPEEDEDLQEQLKEALEAVDELMEPNPAFIESDKKSSNPFTRMFATLRDRYFSADSTLRPSEKSRNPFKLRPIVTTPAPAVKPTTGVPAKKKKHGSSDTDPDMPSLEPIRPPVFTPKPAPPPSTAPKSAPKSAPARTSKPEEGLESEFELPPLVAVGEKYNSKTPQEPAVEELEGEDHGDAQTKKKKKKKKKAKKTAEKVVEMAKETSVTSQTQMSPPASPDSTLKGTPTKPSPLTRTSVDTFHSNFSTASLSHPRETVAQSARSYLQAENLTTEKTKVKTRPAFSTSFLKSDRDKKQAEAEEDKPEKKSMFNRIRTSQLPRKACAMMSRIVGAASGKPGGKKSMKWDDFVKVMKAMGFSYDPSTAGSSVRFDPPNPKDRSATFHKPHPDSTLQRHHLRDFGKKLVRYYGWTQEMFDTFGIAEDEELGEENE